jgi:hypothetical protein
LGVESGRCVGLTTSLSSVSSLFILCVILSNSQPYSSPRPVTGTYFSSSAQHAICILRLLCRHQSLPNSGVCFRIHALTGWRMSHSPDCRPLIPAAVVAVTWKRPLFLGHYSVVVIVYLIILRSLPSSGSICHNTLRRLLDML